ncbi:MAG: tRNA (adenosine(37)-N6)-threonylcarbamoyltransferase complex ATPase subunit type 1 TsaE [Bacteroidetes bacterium]|nr:MAG: tRNA (adenosine(37)-N6)-threonylcarbamoyltransferase complex ATPase subunit type 1 TsaE [Bacteroidota bacterium]
MELVINEERELNQAVTELLSFAGGRKVMLFSGEIGAGKTTFIQAICRHFGVQEQVTSPTFALINEYTYMPPEGQEAYIYHMDLYRLKNIDEALNIGLEDYLYTGDYCFIEWPALIEDLLPEDVVRINITIEADSSRKLVFL